MKKHVVITGVSRGIGQALAEHLIELGHTVTGCARDAEALGRLAKRHGVPNRFDRVDITADDQVRDWAASATATNGPPDLLVNNAALINANNVLWQVPADEFARVVDVNITGTFHTIRHFVPTMIEAGRGVVVNLSSGWGRSTSPEVGPYCATKWAIEGLTQSLAQELPAGLAAVAVSPGMVHTEMLESCFGDSARHNPTPEKWAERSAAFLLGLGPADNGGSLTTP